MKTPSTTNSHFFRITTIPMLIVSIMILFTACKDNKEKDSSEEEVTSEILNSNKVTVVTQLMDFQAPDEIPSGWTTFEYVNNSEEAHFFVLEKLPEGKTIEDSKRDIIPVFQEGMDLINTGKMDEGLAAFGKLPEWFSEIIFLGGPGLVSPKTKAETTLNLEPGYYVMECYVKMPNGMFHSAMGMVAALQVTNEKSNLVPPVSTIKMDISSEKGFEFNKEFSKGLHIIEVNFADQIAHEHFLGHDVHLAKLDDTADLEALEKWMNWADPEGFKTPVPEGIKFLGGTQEMPAGEKAYFKANFNPGTYALIAEVPNAAKKNMLTVFKIE